MEYTLNNKNIKRIKKDIFNTYVRPSILKPNFFNIHFKMTFSITNTKNKVINKRTLFDKNA